MPLIQQKSDELKKLIDQSVEFEGRHYLMDLYNILIQSDKPSEEIEPTADQLIALIKNINEIKNPDISPEQHAIAIENIVQNYKNLVDQAGFQGVFYTSTSLLLALGGMILGFIAGTLGAAVGLLILGTIDIINLRLPTGTLIGALAGLFVGYIIGQNVLQKLFHPNEIRIIQHAVERLESSFESLFSSRFKNCVEEIEQEILEEYFDNKQEDFDLFLKEEQKYDILSVEALFFSEKLKGYIGHHSFIKFSINNSEKAKLIELGYPSDAIVNFTQKESRVTTGERLVHMLAMDRLLKPQYELSISNFFNFLRKYSVIKHDCHDYLNLILESAGEPVSQISRFTDKDPSIGRFVGRALRFFIPTNEENQSHSEYESPEVTP